MAIDNAADVPTSLSPPQRWGLEFRVYAVRPQGLKRNNRFSELPHQLFFRGTK